MTNSLRPVAAALVAAVTGVASLVLALGVPAPAHAAACSGTTGVTVVADFNGLGGGVQGTCITSGGGDSAATLFPAAGLPLSYAQRQPGFVCRVSGVPASDPCVNTSPANAYWGLWWSNGKDGRWTYSSLGAGSLRVPDGGYVAFSWDDVSGDAVPSFTPAAHTSSAPAPQPTQQPTPVAPQPTQQPGQPSPQPTAPPTRDPSGAPSAQPGGTAPTPSAGQPSTGATAGAPGGPASTPSSVPTAPTSPTAPTAPTGAATSPSEDPSATAGLADDTGDELTEPVAPASSEADANGADGGGVPGWVAPLVIVLLFAAAGVVLVLKRRTTP